MEAIKKQLTVSGLNLSSGINLIFTGGGSNFFNIEKYFQDFFGLNIKTVNKNSLPNDRDKTKNFVSCLGALKIIRDGWETEAIPEKSGKDIEKRGFFAKIFGIN